MQKITEMKLDNGVTIIFQKRRSKMAAIVIGVGVGSVNETETQHGLAHFLEHNLFNGTKKFPCKEVLLDLLEANGVDHNAFTSSGMTAYHFCGMSSKIKEMLELGAEMFLNPIFPEKEVEREKLVVKQEIEEHAREYVRVAGRRLFSSLYHNTKAEHDVLGTISSVSSFTRDDLVNFYNKHYVTRNIVVSVAGEFDSKKVLTMIKVLFKGARVGEYESQVSVDVKGVNQKHISIVQPELKQTMVVIGGYGLSVESENYGAVKILSYVLGGSSSSRLYKNIRDKLGACYSIGSINMGFCKYGAFFIHTSTSPKELPAVMEGIANEIISLKTKPISKDEFDRARIGISTSNAISDESTRSVAIANFIGYVYGILGKNDREFFDSVTFENVMCVANKIFDSSAIAVSYVAGKKVNRDITNTFTKRI